MRLIPLEDLDPSLRDLRFSEDPPDPESFLALFETTGWNEMYRRTAEELAQAIHQSWLFLGAYREGELVGAGRVVSDGVQYAVIFDMIVAPEQQGRGIGTAILRHFLRRCEEAGIRDILLFAAKGVAPFYQRHGFVPRQEGAPGMMLRRTAERPSVDQWLEDERAQKKASPTRISAETILAQRDADRK